MESVIRTPPYNSLNHSHAYHWAISKNDCFAISLRTTLKCISGQIVCRDRILVSLIINSTTFTFNSNAKFRLDAIYLMYPSVGVQCTPLLGSNVPLCWGPMYPSAGVQCTPLLGSNVPLCWGPMYPSAWGLRP